MEVEQHRQGDPESKVVRRRAEQQQRKRALRMARLVFPVDVERRFLSNGKSVFRLRIRSLSFDRRIRIERRKHLKREREREGREGSLTP